MRRPSAADLGLHRLAIRLLCANAVLLAATVVLIRASGLTIEAGWGALALHLLPTGLLFAFWTMHRLQPGRENEWWIAEAALAMGIMGVTVSTIAPAQYAVAAFDRPLVDSLLARADASLGIHVPSLVAWTRNTPGIAAVLWLAYNAFIPQTLLVIPLLWWKKDRRALWEYV